MKLSFVIPAYNEEQGIVDFHVNILSPVFEEIIRSLRVENPSDFSDHLEIVYVNDGSSDNTLEQLHILGKCHKEVKIVSLSRNFGKEIAVTAGLSETTGDAVVILDADGQHPPTYIPEFVDKWLHGAQVVVGVRDNHAGSFVKTIGSKCFYRILNAISDQRTVPYSTDFRLLDRCVVLEFLKLKERNRITRGLIDWLGFSRDYVHFSAADRLAGESTYSVRKLFVLALNSFTTLSLAPLMLTGYLGIFIVLLSLLAGGTIFTEQVILDDPLGWRITGAAQLGIFITFLVGILLMAQGLFAVYLSHIYVHSQGRSLFIIDRAKSMNLD